MSRNHIYASLGLATLVLAAGCKRNTADAADTTNQPLVVGTENIVVARQGLVTTGPAISGSLDAALNATIRAQISGAVLATYADIGQSVRKGQLLAQRRCDDAAGSSDERALRRHVRAGYVQRG